MAKNQSSLMQDAYMRGDKERGDSIKQEIEVLYEKSFPKKRSSPNILKTNSVLNNDNSSARVVYDYLNKYLDEDWWEWEIETIDQMLWTKYGIALDTVNRDKMLAIRHILRNDAAFFDWYEFNQLSLSFGSAIADFEILRRPSPGMIISCVKTMKYIRSDREGFFGIDVIKYICLSLINDGISTPPPSLSSMISKEMGKLVSEKSKNAWEDAMKKYSDILKTRNFEIKEIIPEIQAKRLLNAEAAAGTYY